ncbi:MAG: DNA polymerase IV [Candidatus Eisenbacteria bacterium]|nr:DNA polymerase IV [Candidatus Eisenbacteria bacterium]
MTWILHVDFDAFFASVEQARNPALRGRPVVVGNGVIASCSYEARRCGLSNGMPLSRAARLCPSVVILDGSYPTYRALAERIFSFCRDVSPNVETFLDEAYIELTGTERLHGHPLSVGHALRERVRRETGLPVTAGIGRSRMIAKMAGKRAKPDGLGFIPPGTEAETIAPFPIRDLPGVGHAYGALLEKLQVRTIEELRAFPAPALRKLFGVHGDLLFRRCRGEDTAVIEEREIPRSISRETSFHRDTSDRREIEGMLFYLSERAARALRALRLEARTVGIRIRYAGGGSEAMSRSLPKPAALHPPILRAALDLLRRVYARREALHLVGVSLANIARCGPRQTDLYDEEEAERSAALSRALDEARDRFGFSSVVAGRSLDLVGKLERNSHGFVLRTPSLTK